MNALQCFAGLVGQRSSLKAGAREALAHELLGQDQERMHELEDRLAKRDAEVALLSEHVMRLERQLSAAQEMACRPPEVVDSQSSSLQDRRTEASERIAKEREVCELQDRLAQEMHKRTELQGLVSNFESQVTAQQRLIRQNSPGRPTHLQPAGPAAVPIPLAVPLSPLPLSPASASTQMQPGSLASTDALGCSGQWVPADAVEGETARRLVWRPHVAPAACAGSQVVSPETSCDGAVWRRAAMVLEPSGDGAAAKAAEARPMAAREFLREGSFPAAVQPLRLPSARPPTPVQMGRQIAPLAASQAAGVGALLHPTNGLKQGVVYAVPSTTPSKQRGLLGSVGSPKSISSLIAG